MLKRNTTWEISTTLGRTAFPQTTRKPCAGIGWPQSKGMLEPSTFLERSTPGAKAFPRTEQRLRGYLRPQVRRPQPRAAGARPPRHHPLASSHGQDGT